MTGMSRLTLRQAAEPRRPTRGDTSIGVPRHATLQRARVESHVGWTFTFVAFLGYIFAVTTYKLPIAEASMIVALIGLLLQRERLRLPAMLLWSGLLLGWCALGYLYTDFPAVVWENVVVLAKLCLIMLVAVNALRSPAQVRFFMIFFLACYALFPVRGTMVNYFVAHYTIFGRALWNYMYSNPNDLAALTLLPLSTAAALLATERTGWIRLGAIAGIAVLPVLILMTQSRGGFIALCVFAAFALRGQRRRLRTPLIVAGLALGVIAVAPSGVWKRVEGLSHVAENLDQVDPEGSAKQRFQVWQMAVSIVGDHPWTGVGWGAYPMAHAQYAPLSGADGPRQLGQRDTHSTYLNVLAETGYPGLVLFLTLLWSAVREAEKARRLCRKGQPLVALQLKYLELGLLAFLVAGVWASYAKLSFLYLHVVLLWAVAQNATRAAQQAHVLAARQPAQPV